MRYSRQTLATASRCLSPISQQRDSVHPEDLHTVVFEFSTGKYLGGHSKLEQTMSQHRDSVHTPFLHSLLAASSIGTVPSEHSKESQ